MITRYSRLTLPGLKAASTFHTNFVGPSVNWAEIPDRIRGLNAEIKRRDSTQKSEKIPAWHLYVMQAGSFDTYKVGIALYPIHRLRELQTGCPWILTIVYQQRVAAHAWVEAHAHRQLSSWRTGGGTEWFSCERAVIIRAIEKAITESTFRLVAS